ncbi:MAG: L,D-transpeptidase family protein [Rhodospirillaceae bacterium]|nr:L,D-transpeptidase family protein [Rhodospirillaceae bacterium]MDD9999711.1 L,D-transpeptidase family protein [Rhodospirillaceae bacterium]MDE0362201.1 L,D-transpeptidase family protein [Rhodospirillaceae bacterium]
MGRLIGPLLLLLLPFPHPGGSLANELSPQHPRADRIVVLKSERKLHLYRAGEILRSFDIALGLVPEGPKRESGDLRTPEGRYHLESKNPESAYFMALKVSYPNERDEALAAAAGVDPGGLIMIHGQPNDGRFAAMRGQGMDWTDGCIAVSNSDMVDIWLMTAEGMPIDIQP